MKAVILDQATFGQDSIDWSRLLSLPVDWTCYQQTTSNQLAGRIAEAEIILTNKVPLSANLIDKAAKLKYIGVLATGTNNIALDAAQQRGIQVQNVEKYGTESVAQHTMMLILSLCCNTFAYQQRVQRGDWSRVSTFCLLDVPITELAGKHLVIVGYGELGKRVAELAQAFSMKVTVARRPGKHAVESPGEARPFLDHVLPEADVVSVHCLLSSETQNLFDAARLRLMKPSAFLINTARGGLIDEQALYQALQRGELAGAAVDVLTEEPPPLTHPYVASPLPNLLVTPHNAWASKEARQRLLNIAADHLQAFLQIPPENHDRQ